MRRARKLLFLLLLAPALMAAQNDPVSRARQLARSGGEHRAEALRMLQEYLESHPGDTDARTLYGLALSWDGHYDQAREQLRQVLAGNPTHGDALPALMNVEMWSGHPEAADRLAGEGLAAQPENTEWLMARARALRKMNRDRDALLVVDHVLALDRKNAAARQMRREITVSTLESEVLVTHAYDWFSDGRGGQHLTTLSVKNAMNFGSFIGRMNRADRFGTSDYQGELDFYPHFRAGTYGYFNAGYSPRGLLFPEYRLGADLYQMAGRGFELSGGFRRLGFGAGTNIYTFSLARYYRDWLFTGRGFVVPGSPGASGTAQFTARYFLGSEGLHDYIEIGYSHGASPALAQTTQEIETLADSRYSLSFDKAVGRRWVGYFTGSVAQAQRLGLAHLMQYEIQGGFYFRF
ncbi:MAG: YaiO family outer membrane beta-barrel protein [Acidobacteria bacterium]|nr:YaiO family outer membrane beta-barrel protein [Acidobacteriota bacterium]